MDNVLTRQQTVRGRNEWDSLGIYSMYCYLIEIGQICNTLIKGI